jgi:hypothetical protein
MSIHYAADRHPIVGKAIQDAGDIVHGWLDSRDQEELRPLVVGWSAVALVESIAYTLLQERGFDIEGLDAALEEADARCHGDILGSWPESGAPEGFWDDEGEP